MNTHGEVYATLTDTMAAYDALPSPVRRVISEAPFPYSTTYMLEVWEASKGNFSSERAAAEALAAFITTDFTTKLARAEL